MEPETSPGVPEEPTHISLTPYLFVLPLGIITSMVALAGVYWLDKNVPDFHVMGWYANYVIPVGAIIVGLAAGSGYGIASWLTGVRISRSLLWTVLLLQTAAYVGAEYVEYRDVMGQFEKAGVGLVQDQRLPTFLEYYDFKARSFAWKAKNGNGAGSAGWLGVLLCSPRGGGVHPGRVPRPSHPDRDALLRRLSALHEPQGARRGPRSRARQEDCQEGHGCTGGLRQGTGGGGRERGSGSRRLREASAAGNVDAFTQELAASASGKLDKKLARRVVVSLTWCKSCESGRIALTLVSVLGDQVTQVPMADTTVSPEFVRALVAG